METLYRRALPDHLVPFASAEGRELFGEALGAGRMAGYFRLAQQFHTQADPGFCSLGSLVVALNALDIDPGRLWRGPWRWFSEELLDCCVSLDHVREHGMTLDEVACLARCNGANASVFRPDESGPDELRAQLVATSEQSDGPILVVNYDRGTLGQTGSGHYSPLAGYHEPSDRVLILDVARFKYPPHWVETERLWEALRPVDPSSGRARGWLSLTPSHARLNLGFWLESTAPTWSAMASGLRESLLNSVGSSPPRDLRAAAVAYLDGVLASGIRLRSQECHATEHEIARADIYASLRSSALWELAASAAPNGMETAVAAMLLATAPAQWVDALDPAVAADWRRMVDGAPDAARSEARRIAAQLEHVMCACA